jgi:hypothetical protein
MRRLACAVAFLAATTSFAAQEDKAPGAPVVEASKAADGVFKAWGHGHAFVIAEGRLEPASVGSYSISVFKTDGPDADIMDLTTGIVRPRDGGICSCWVADLNQDKQPEILVWIQSAGSGSYGTLEVFTLAGKLLKPLPFPKLTENQSKGYMGHDIYHVTGKEVQREFPLYRDKDTNADPSGARKVITYELKGEAWKVVDE